MELKDRKSLLAFVAEAGYSGEKNLKDIQKWWDSEDSGIEVTDQKGNRVAGKDLDALWKRVPSAKITATDDAGDDDASDDAPDTKSVSKRVGRMNADIHDSKNDSRSPKAFRRIAEQKAYNRKAADGKTSFSDAEEAEVFGAWGRSVLTGKIDHDEKAFDREICQKANITTSNSSGGALVPSDFSAQLIDLKELYGVTRQVLGVIPLSGPPVDYPRITGGTTVYAPGEASAITESNATFDTVRLTPQKLACYSEVSAELIHDSAINFGDVLAKRMAYEFAKAEDNAFINGDGTSTYYGFNGVRNTIKNKSATIANIAGLVVGAGNAYSELTLNNFIEVIARAPAYVDMMNPYWIVHKRFDWEVMKKLANAAVGLTGTEMVNGVPRSIFQGYPVMHMQVMPRVEANSQVCALFGAFGEGAKFGEVRNSMSIATSEHFKFSSDVIAFRAIERVALTVHDVGNASATEASREAGPIVGLITAAA